MRRLHPPVYRARSPLPAIPSYFLSSGGSW